jgi:Uri superfamily endonuclease
MPRGNYLYLGSAYGPGGLPARLRRHLRADKRLHWHVDHLTIAGTVERVFALPNGCECDLVDHALKLPAIHAPIAGFGSSDCRRCTAHLLAVPRDSAALINAFAALS